MFEHKSQPVLSNTAFARRMLHAFVITLLIVAGSLEVPRVRFVEGEEEEGAAEEVGGGV